jgi:putative membrane protein
MTSRLAWAPFVAMALTQIAIPLTDDDATLEWLSSLVVVAFFLTTLAVVVARWGVARALGAATFVVVATALVEKLGTTTGFPFGAYDYTGALQPTVAGVPVIVPLAWFAMGVTALEVGHHVGSRVVAVVVGALGLTAWDLFLDPQMVDAGYWEWEADGAYQGIPLTNYAGWILTGLVVLSVVERIRPASPPSSGLRWLYTWWAVMNTIGFVVFFGEPFVGLIGGLGMGAITALAWARTR